MNSKSKIVGPAAEGLLGEPWGGALVLQDAPAPQDGVSSEFTD